MVSHLGKHGLLGILLGRALAKENGGLVEDDVEVLADKLEVFKAKPPITLQLSRSEGHRPRSCQGRRAPQTA